MMNMNYEVLLCMIHMVLMFPVVFLCITMLMRIDRRPQIEFTCDGEEMGNKHKFGYWEMTKAVTSDNRTTYVTQMRKCSKCGYTQFKKVRV